jgi:hypothetical protein
MRERRVITAVLAVALLVFTVGPASALPGPASALGGVSGHREVFPLDSGWYPLTTGERLTGVRLVARIFDPGPEEVVVTAQGPIEFALPACDPTGCVNGVLLAGQELRGTSQAGDVIIHCETGWVTPNGHGALRALDCLAFIGARIWETRIGFSVVQTRASSRFVGRVTDAPPGP